MTNCCTLNITAACAAKDAEISDLKQRLASQEPEDVQVAKARCEDTLNALRGVLAILERDGGFRTPRQQATMRGARALLVEHGQPVPRQRLA